MKKSRLLEIIREEINEALNVLVTNKKGETTTMPFNTPDEKKNIEALKKDANITNIETTAGQNIKEEDLNEEPDFGGQLDKKVAAKYGEEDTLEAATEKVTNRVLSDKGITKADVAKMDAQELKALLKDIRAFISQKKQSPEVAAALEKQKEFDDSGSNLQDNQTNKAILRVLGFGSKKGPKGPTKSKAEKPAKEKTSKEKTTAASKAEPMDGEDKEATQNVGSDSTAKELGATASVADKFANLFNAKTTEEAKKKMQELARKANSGDQKAKAFFDDKKNSKIIQAYRKAQNVKV